VKAVVALTAGGLLWAAACVEPRDATPPLPDARVLRAPDTAGLEPVPVPDLSTMSESVQRGLRERIEKLRESLSSASPPEETLADRYGDVATVLLAARYFSESEQYFLNAHTLTPMDRRWPYYLGHVYRNVGPLDEAARFFEQANQLQPNDSATLIWLGEVYLAQGRHDGAAALFERVTAREPASAAAWFGAGRAALAGGDRAQATAALEESLLREPTATAVHYPLAMAYRGLGDLERAEAHLARQGDVAPRPVDPLMSALGDLLESPEVYSSRGRSALAAGNWPGAADLFDKGLAMAPADPFLRYGFGFALMRMGDAGGAEAAFRRAIQTSPRHVEAYYTLAEVLDGTGRPVEAVATLRLALEYTPGHVAARTKLAGILGRTGAPEEALQEFARTLELAPANAEAAFGYAMNLVRVDRFQAARDALAEAVQSFPDPTPFRLALARLLAAAPDARVRDGRRALEMAEDLLESAPGLALGETLAMALAELGRFADATQVQRDVVAAAQQARLDDTVVRRMTENLSLYEGEQACRRPFGADEMP